MRIGLIGMSGAGKTAWATRLADAGFEHLDCDRLIAAKLSAEVGQPLATMDDLGAWLGFPYQAGFRAREKRYMACELAVLNEIAGYLGRADMRERDLVVDMGGSAIYAGAALFLKLRRLMTIVYLAVPQAAYDQMLQNYLRRPRPIIWQGQFRPRPGEPHDAALAHCYPQLIAFRERWYQALCDLQLDYETHQRSGIVIEDFLRLVRAPAAGSQ